ncbi:MAG: energy-coupling factor ABC transporter ATP-binding protein [Clostridia bacterium]|nr:energy-coupling factor ABC transporter ATP-binding protein [Clostridia bacterium]
MTSATDNKISVADNTSAENTAAALKNCSLHINEGEFVVLCGRSGCGKTTLLKLIKREIAPHGKRTGNIFYNDLPLESLDLHTSASEIAYVAQNPEAQIVTDKVWHEMAFGMENLGADTEKIRLRVGETANYFGINTWFRRETATLSGGQKQLLNLAAAMTMAPRLLLLDEPTSQLDPIAATNFINTLYKLNRGMGITVIIAEHRLEELFPIADRVIVMDGGEVIANDAPRKVCRMLADHPVSAAFPAATRIFAGIAKKTGETVNTEAAKNAESAKYAENAESAQNAEDVKYAKDAENAEAASLENIPLTVREGREFLKAFVGSCPGAGDEIKNKNESLSPESVCGEAVDTVDVPPAVVMKNVWFRYERNSADILRGTGLSVKCGEIFSVLGGNGSGKTTMLKVLSGISCAYRGRTELFGKNIKNYSRIGLHHGNVALLPQNVDSVFIKKTVREDLLDICRIMGMSREESGRAVDEMAERLGISEFVRADRHPYDLSGGEMQKCALAKVLLTRPRLLLLDEPTKGIDAYAKNGLGEILKSLKSGGVTVIIVTHDVEFAAEVSDRVALFFDGEVLSPATPQKFFGSNYFYTTAPSRISRDIFTDTVTVSDLLKKLSSLF